MADLKLVDEIRSRRKSPAIPGGARRPSLKANLQAHPQVRRRQQLNELLLANSCGNGERVEVKLRATDLPILVQIASERGANTNPLLRRQAIDALSQFRTLEAAEVLAVLARSTVEHPSVRISAQTALQTLSPSLASAADLTYHKVPIIRAQKGKRAAPPEDKR